jgi:uncharacterized protein (TIGR02145 family)
MKETGTAHWISPNTDATNSSGFTGLPGGYRDYVGPFTNIGKYCNWWSSSEFDAMNAVFRYLEIYSGFVLRTLNGKTLGFSVRCLRD